MLLAEPSMVEKLEVVLAELIVVMEEVANVEEVAVT